MNLPVFSCRAMLLGAMVPFVLGACGGDSGSPGAGSGGSSPRNPDGVQPTLSFLATPPALSNTGEAAFQVASDLAGTALRMKLDDTPEQDTPASFTLADLADGVHSVTVSGTGPDGTTSANRLVFAWEINTSAPEIQVDSPLPDTQVDAPSVVFSGTVGDDGGIVKFRVNGNEAAIGESGTWSVDVGLTPGDNAIAVEATDAFGNSTRITVSVHRLVDPTANLAATGFLPRPGTYGEPIEVTLSAGPNAEIFYRLGGGILPDDPRDADQITAYDAPLAIAASTRISARAYYYDSDTDTYLASKLTEGTYTIEQLAPSVGLVAGYNFVEAAGSTTVTDASRAELIVDLDLGDVDGTGAWQWTAGGLTFTGNAKAQSRADETAPALQAIAATDRFTVEAWVTAADILAGGTVLSIGSGQMPGNGRFVLEYAVGERGGRFVARIRDGIVITLESVSAIVQEAGPHHLLYTHAGNKADFYIDGERIAGTHPTLGPAIRFTGNEPLVLGNTGDAAPGVSTKPWNGTYHLLGIYDLALDSDQVRQHYSAGPNRPVLPLMPTIRPSAGIYTDQVTVTLDHEPGAQVYYTTDGSTPTVDSLRYEGPFTLFASATVKAVVVDGQGASGIAGVDYIVEPAIGQ